MPRRAAGNHLVFRGSELVLVSEARGRRLHIGATVDDAAISACIAPLEHLLNRSTSRSDRIEIETINGQPAPKSEYLPALRGVFDVLIDHRLVTLRRRFS